MKKQIFSIEEAAGKTISGAEDHWNEYILAFTDDTFLHIKAKDEYHEGECTLSTNNPIDLRNFSHEALVRLGIASQQEADEAREAREAALQEQKEESDRREYERLKAKFKSENA